MASEAGPLNSETRMFPRAEWPSLSPEELQEQIDIRNHMIDHILVGSLYPMIMADEIADLREIQELSK